MKFFSEYWYYFKRMWQSPWLYFLLIMITIGSHSLTTKIIIAAISVVVLPVLIILCRIREGKINKKE